MYDKRLGWLLGNEWSGLVAKKNVLAAKELLLTPEGKEILVQMALEKLEESLDGFDKYGDASVEESAEA